MYAFFIANGVVSSNLSRLSFLYSIYAIKCLFYSPLVSFDCDIVETTCQANAQKGAEPNLSRKHKNDKIIGIVQEKESIMIVWCELKILSLG